MNQTDNNFSTQKITPQLISQIIDALRNKAYGSVEIFVENFNVVQITERTITKVNRPTNPKRLLWTKKRYAINISTTKEPKQKEEMETPQ